MTWRHQGGPDECDQHQLDRRQTLADLAQISVDREQALADSRQAELEIRWAQAAMAQALVDLADRAALASCQRMVRELAEDQRRHDARQELIDQTQAANDSFQRLIDAQQTELDETAQARSDARVAQRAKRARASVGRRRARARNAGTLADECM